MKILRKKITNKSAKVAVIGLGYVGLPVACLLAKAGFDVIGINRGEEKVAQINRGESPIKGDEPGLEKLLKKSIKSGNLSVTTEYSVLKNADIVLVAVDTPVDEQTKVPKYTSLKSVLKSFGPHIKKSCLVIIESTIAPGTIQQIVKPELEKYSGKTVSKDFYLANCPERVTPGKLLHQLENWPRVVGGFDRKTADLAVSFYKKFVKGELDATTSTTAEIVKTEENTFRDTLIAQANALALLCEHFGVNVYEVIKLIKKDPEHTAYLYPGAGVGGHCLPKDGYLKIALTRKDNNNPLVSKSIDFVELAREVNEFMPSHMLFLLKEALEEAGVKTSKPKIAVLGFSYLENSDDTRNSPTQLFLKAAVNGKMNIVVQDPFVEEYKTDLEKTLKGADALVFMVSHRDYKKLNLRKVKNLMRTPVIIDGRNIFNKEEVEKQGFIYKGVGNA